MQELREVSQAGRRRYLSQVNRHGLLWVFGCKRCVMRRDPRALLTQLAPLHGADNSPKQCSLRTGGRRPVTIQALDSTAPQPLRVRTAAPSPQQVRSSYPRLPCCPAPVGRGQALICPPLLECRAVAVSIKCSITAPKQYTNYKPVLFYAKILFILKHTFLVITSFIFTFLLSYLSKACPKKALVAKQ